MKCASREDLLRLIDKELPEESVRDLRAHIDRCPRCQEALTGLRRDLEAIRDSFQSLEPSAVVIPPFEYARSAGSRRSGKPAGHPGSAFGRTPIARLQPAAFLLAAAVLAFLILTNLVDRSPVELLPDEIAEGESEYFEDPNTAWHQRQLVITIRDDKQQIQTTVVTSAINTENSPVSPNINNQTEDSAT